jgi:hypothetical protein
MVWFRQWKIWYNRKDSRLKEALRQGRREKTETEHEESMSSVEGVPVPIGQVMIYVRNSK